MDSSATDLRMSKKTIYKYFPGKEKLVEEIISDFMNSRKKRLTKYSAQKKMLLQKLRDSLNLLEILFLNQRKLT